jgi:hypothetical protein
MEPTTPLPDEPLASTPILEDTPSWDAAPSADAAPAASVPSPRTRWGAIVWGALFAAIAGIGIWMLGSAARRDGITDWLASLTPGMITALGLLLAGLLALVTGLVGLIRHAQRRLSETR